MVSEDTIPYDKRRRFMLPGESFAQMLSRIDMTYPTRQEAAGELGVSSRTYYRLIKKFEVREYRKK